MSKNSENPFDGLDGQIAGEHVAITEHRKKEIARLKELLNPFDSFVEDNLLKLVEARGWQTDRHVTFYPEDFGWTLAAVKNDNFVGVILVELITLHDPNYYCYDQTPYPNFEESVSAFSFFRVTMKNMPDRHWMPGNPGHNYYDPSYSTKGTSENSSEKAFIKTLYDVVKDYEMRYGPRN